MCCGGSVTQVSGQYVLNLEDLKRVGMNFLIFATPSIGIGIASLQGGVDPKIAFTAFGLNILHALMDVGRKFMDTPK